MKDVFLARINDLFDSYDLFSSSGKMRTREKIKVAFPNIEKEDLEEIEAYLDGFYDNCVDDACALADIFKVPFIPSDDESKAEVKEYITKCREKYPEIDERHIEALLSTVCWLQNR